METSESFCPFLWMDFMTWFQYFNIYIISGDPLQLWLAYLPHGVSNSKKCKFILQSPNNFVFEKFHTHRKEGGMLNPHIPIIQLQQKFWVFYSLSSTLFLLAYSKACPGCNVISCLQSSVCIWVKGDVALYYLNNVVALMTIIIVLW